MLLKETTHNVFSDADYPGKDISDVVYVSISEKDDKPVHVYIADNSKGQRAVQAYIGTLNVKYPGKVNITGPLLMLSHPATRQRKKV